MTHLTPRRSSSTQLMKWNNTKGTTQTAIVTSPSPGSPCGSRRCWCSLVSLWQDRQKFPPRPHRFPILERHGLRDLLEMAQVVKDQRRDQLPRGDPAHLRVD